MESRCLLACTLAIFAAMNFAEGFSFPPSQLRSFVSSPRNDLIGDGSWKTYQSARGSGTRAGPAHDLLCNNELSRVINVFDWLGSGAASSRRGPKTKDVSISATPTECRALAARFRIANITAFTADMMVTPALGKIEGNDCIEATGTIRANVTQTCVRTNEAFDVSLEFIFETVLRPMAPTRSHSVHRKEKEEPLSAGEFAALEAASKLEHGRQPRKKKRQNNKRGGANGQAINDAGMQQLSDILMEYEVTDDIIEDEHCLRTNGQLDCGEIAAQMFRLKLDPYPKKPGSAPVSYSFTF